MKFELSKPKPDPLNQNQIELKRKNPTSGKLINVLSSFFFLRYFCFPLKNSTFCSKAVTLNVKEENNTKKKVIEKKTGKKRTFLIQLKLAFEVEVVKHILFNAFYVLFTSVRIIVDEIID